MRESCQAVPLPAMGPPNSLGRNGPRTQWANSSLGFTTGNPWVAKPNPHPHPLKTRPAGAGVGFPFPRIYPELAGSR
jgi:hypothetical protein